LKFLLNENNIAASGRDLEQFMIRGQNRHPSGAYLEESRFTTWQLCRIAAGGSRELPSVFAAAQRCERFHEGKPTPEAMANRG
jgi:hypothetical protein